ncbi:flagellar motor switch phosphatase FliY [Serpentinicella sp. ANB-PHB4]|uniref:flagellar motor switch phosphatase FliY n=1 Tax=Serpentinicella sp. ANB-PHB4 TaxID=3074076 RepID=UPI002857E47A|nr:flagellar motor switch phosphatase FliY [Serpentinicella sp. ANB-PHB4]MDR5658257.1 flagellar motor switch phosphatase FliY [Serpentinicella sp. ANB-PHB4]
MTDMLSQEEIDALLTGSSVSSESEENENNEAVPNFSDDEKDAIGEIGNISMGTSATTLSTLLGQKVTITTPKVSVTDIKELSEQYPLPFVAVDVRYKEGIEGTNILIIKEDDVKVITDLMMGGEGTISKDPISELHLSAISEAMNQMVGSASTSLSEMFSKKIDIHPPRSIQLNLKEDDLSTAFSDIESYFVRIAFRMVIGDLIDSEIMQIIPLDFAKEMVDALMLGESLGEDETDANIDATVSHNDINTSFSEESNRGQQNINLEDKQPQKNINVQPLQFQSFDSTSQKSTPENIDLIQDVPLKVTVELGRTVKKISEVLEFGPGTIVELDKLVGEPLDILVNGQYVAKGEVVVIDENYGIRITDIINPTKRFNKL